MKQSIARALRRLADRFDPAGRRTGVTNITVNNHGCSHDGRLAQAQHNLAREESRLAQMRAADGRNV